MTQDQDICLPDIYVQRSRIGIQSKSLACVQQYLSVTRLYPQSQPMLGNQGILRAVVSHNGNP
jgi:hypothetical protein